MKFSWCRRPGDRHLRNLYRLSAASSLLRNTKACGLNPRLIIRRLGVTLAVAIVFISVIAMFSEDAAGLLFLPSWGALFFGWPYLSRKLNFNFPKSPADGRPANVGRLVVTFWLATVLAVGIVRSLDSDVGWIAFIPAWLGLYYGWPYLDRKLSLNRKRGLAWALGVLLALAAVSSIVIAPIALSFWRAKKASDSIHVGMTVPELLPSVRGCDLFQATSNYPYNRSSDGDNIPSVHLSWRKEGTYRTYDYGTQQFVELTAAQAIDRLHTKLHDGYQWSFHYTYVNMTPMHVSFRVDFGLDGRVSQVQPGYSWD